MIFNLNFLKVKQNKKINYNNNLNTFNIIVDSLKCIVMYNVILLDFFNLKDIKKTTQTQHRTFVNTKESKFIIEKLTFLQLKINND